MNDNKVQEKKIENGADYKEYLRDRDKLIMERDTSIELSKRVFKQKLDLLKKHHQIKILPSVAKNVRKYSNERN